MLACYAEPRRILAIYGEVNRLFVPANVKSDFLKVDCCLCSAVI